MTTPHTHTPRTPSQDQPDPEVLGRRYAKTVSTVLDTTAEIAHEVWLRETANMTGRPVDPTLLRHLKALQADAEAHLAQATTQAELLNRLTPTQAGPALATVHDELENRLRRRLHEAKRRLVGEPIDHPHASSDLCPLNDPDASIADTEPDLYVYLTEATPEELATEVAGAVTATHDHIGPAFFDPTTDFSNELSQAHQAHQLRNAQAGLRWFNLLGQRLTHFTSDDACLAIGPLTFYTNQELNGRAHNTRHQLQPDPNTRCSRPDCNLQRPRATES